MELDLTFHKKLVEAGFTCEPYIDEPNLPCYFLSVKFGGIIAAQSEQEGKYLITFSTSAEGYEGQTENAVAFVENDSKIESRPVIFESLSEAITYALWLQKVLNTCDHLLDFEPHFVHLARLLA